MPDFDSEDDPAELVSILSARLAVPGTSAPPTIDSLGLGDGKRISFEWQKRRSHAMWNDLHAAVSGRSVGDWTTELHGLLGVAAEQVLVAMEAEIEKALIKAELAGLASDSSAAARRASYSRSLRFFAEGQANGVVVGLHSLANLVLRTLALDPAFSLSQLKPLGVKQTDFVPGSVAKSAWLSFTPGTVAQLVVTAHGLSGDSVALADELSALAAEPAIIAILDLRNVQYHRWRGETPGVTGIDIGSRSTRSKLEAGEVVGIEARLLPDYVGGQAALEELVTSSREALDALIRHMEPLHERWFAAFRAAFPG